MFDDFLEFSFKCYSFILLAVGLGVKLISFSGKKKIVCEENNFFFKLKFSLNLFWKKFVS
jgi:hypothetical protein